MPAAESTRRSDRTSSSGLRLTVALAFGAAGVVSAYLARARPTLLWLTAGAWLAALITFGSAWSGRRLALPPVAAAVAGAGVLTILATRSWLLAPVALAAWTAAARLLAVRWTVFLAAAAGALTAAGAARTFGNDGGADALACLAYVIACVACCTAAVARLRI